MRPAPNRVKAVFMSVLDAEPAARAAILDEMCAGDDELRQRVEAMLHANDRADPLLDQPAADHLTSSELAVPAPDPAEERGAEIAGRYRLREVIGEGGMGSVWLAEQTEPVRRTVALKLIKAGMDSRSVLARFEAERQALALMDHPHIAKVLDGGTTAAGRPFFVMEYVPGLPLTEYCDAERVDVSGRLALFVQVCQAVQHAHQKGVIHRDLKPGNILVRKTDAGPVPKVIDFGLAKAVHQPLTETTLETGPGMLLGTLQYMSPEQAELDNPDVDTRADVYALGVILYELLTGTTPVERPRLKKAAWLEVLRLIREEEPPRPSTRLSGSGSLADVAAQRNLEPVRLTRLVRGDLDWVVMKALEKDRARRYDSAGGFAQDIARYLAGDPVAAHPPSTRYRLRKFVRRNRPQVIAAGLVAAALVAGIVGTTVGLVEARRQERLARDREGEAHTQERIARGERDAKETARQQEAEQRTLAEGRLKKLEKGIEILGTVFARIDPNAEALGGDPVVVAIERQLELAVAELQGEAVGDPLVVARLQRILGNSLVAIGRAKKAVEVLESAVATRTRLGADDVDALTLRADLANAYANAGEAKRGIAEFEAVEPALVRRLGATEARVLKVRREHAAALIAARREDDAIGQLTAFANDCQVAGRENDRDALVAANMLARAYLAAGQHAPALALMERLITVIQRAFGVDHPESLAALNSMAVGYRQAGRPTLALGLQRRACELLRARLRDDHPVALAARYDLALAAGDAGRYAEAVEILERLRDVHLKAGLSDPGGLRVRYQLGLAYVRAGRPELGVDQMEWVLEGWRHQQPVDGPDMLAARMGLGIALAAAGRTGQAVRVFDFYLANGQTRGKQTAVQILLARTHLADALRRDGKFDRAARLASVALTSAEQAEKLGPDHPTTLLCRDHLAAVYLAQGRRADAIALLEKNFRPAARMGPDHPDFLRYGLHWMTARLEAGDVENARTALERDADLARKTIGEAHPLTLEIVQALADVLGREKAWDRAVAERRKVVDAERKRVEELRAREAELQKAGVPAGRVPAADCPFPAAAQVQLGQTLLAAGRFAEAEPPLREVLTFMDRAQTESWDRFAAKSMLGEAIAGQKKYADAEPLLLDGHRGLSDRAKAIPKTSAQAVPRARERLVQLYEAWGRPADAEKWRADRGKK